MNGGVFIDGNAPVRWCSSFSMWLLGYLSPWLFKDCSMIKLLVSDLQSLLCNYHVLLVTLTAIPLQFGSSLSPSRESFGQSLSPCHENPWRRFSWDLCYFSAGDTASHSSSWTALLGCSQEPSPGCPSASLAGFLHLPRALRSVTWTPSKLSLPGISGPSVPAVHTDMLTVPIPCSLAQIPP